MKVLCKKPITIRGKELGGKEIFICVPMISHTKEEIKVDAKVLASLAPDIIEWCCDYYQPIENVGEIQETLREISSIIGDIPLLVRLRHVDEGGFQFIPQDLRLKIIEAILETSSIDIMDVEISNDPDFIQKVRDLTTQHKTHLMLSYHNFKETPSEEFLVDKICEANRLGADIPKIAVMPHNYGDVLKVLNSTYRARKTLIETPLVTVSMGDMGQVSRAYGGLFGSDLTFAVGKESSAVGQISLAQLRALLENARASGVNTIEPA